MLKNNAKCIDSLTKEIYEELRKTPLSQEGGTLWAVCKAAAKILVKRDGKNKNLTAAG